MCEIVVGRKTCPIVDGVVQFLAVTTWIIVLGYCLIVVWSYCLDIIAWWYSSHTQFLVVSVGIRLCIKVDRGR